MKPETLANALVEALDSFVKAEDEGGFSAFMGEMCKIVKEADVDCEGPLFSVQLREKIAGDDVCLVEFLVMERANGTRNLTVMHRHGSPFFKESVMDKLGFIARAVARGAESGTVNGADIAEIFPSVNAGVADRMIAAVRSKIV